MSLRMMQRREKLMTLVWPWDCRTAPSPYTPHFVPVVQLTNLTTSLPLIEMEDGIFPKAVSVELCYLRLTWTFTCLPTGGLGEGPPNRSWLQVSLGPGSQCFCAAVFQFSDQYQSENWKFHDPGKMMESGTVFCAKIIGSARVVVSAV